ncbi:hypothetical protein RCL1_001724 [Eukaryota sp. TZLM3-RCL]
MSSIFIATDKTSYVGGDTVTGTIYLSSRGINATSVLLRVKGYESTNFSTKKTEWYDRPDGTRASREIIIDHSGSRTFFDDSLTIYQLQGGLAPGNYTFPFSYTLPSSLPGVINVTGSKFGENYEAHIVYRLTATITVPGMFFSNNDMNAHQDLLVYERFDENQAPAHEQAERRVLFCCCIPKGRVYAEAYFEDRTFIPGERPVQVYLKFRNESTVNVRTFETKLMRHLTLRSHSGETTTITDEVAKESYSGVAAGQNAERPVPLNLPIKTLPSCESLYIQCKYTLVVEAVIPFCPNLSIRLPCAIKPPVSLYAPTPIPTGIQWVAPQMGHQQSHSGINVNVDLNAVANAAGNVMNGMIGAMSGMAKALPHAIEPAYPSAPHAHVDVSHEFQHPHAEVSMNLGGLSMNVSSSSHHHTSSDSDVANVSMSIGGGMTMPSMNMDLNMDTSNMTTTHYESHSTKTVNGQVVEESHFVSN